MLYGCQNQKKKYDRCGIFDTKSFILKLCKNMESHYITHCDTTTLDVKMWKPCFSIATRVFFQTRSWPFFEGQIYYISYCFHLHYMWNCGFFHEWYKVKIPNSNFDVVNSKQDFDANFSIEFRKWNFIVDCLVNNFESQGLKCRDKLSVHFMMNNLNALSWLNLFLCYVIWST